MDNCGVWFVHLVQPYVFARASPSGRHMAVLGVQIPYTTGTHSTTVTYCTVQLLTAEGVAAEVFWLTSK